MVLIEIEGCQAETMRVIGKAEEYVRENKITKGQIWCVYDKDSFPSCDVNGVVQRANMLNQKNPELQYHAAWSNECIEFWFMLHFAYYTSNNMLVLLLFTTFSNYLSSVSYLHQDKSIP